MPARLINLGSDFISVSIYQVKGLSGIFNGPDIFVVGGPYEHFKSLNGSVASDPTPAPSRSQRRKRPSPGPAHHSLQQKRDRLAKTRELAEFVYFFLFSPRLLLP